MNAAAAASRFSQPNTPSPSATTSSPVGTSLQRSSSTSSHSYLTAPRPPLSASSNAASNSINGGRSTSLLSRPTTSHSAASSDTGGSISSSTHAPAPCLPTQPAAAAGTNSSDLLRRVSNGDGSTSSTSASASASTSSLAATRVPGQTKHRWSSDETQALVDGCNKHGVGSWKIILDDASFAGRFVNRTAGDLKDRFRTYFPDAYHELVSECTHALEVRIPKPRRMVGELTKNCCALDSTPMPKRTTGAKCVPKMPKGIASLKKARANKNVLFHTKRRKLCMMDMFYMERIGPKLAKIPSFKDSGLRRICGIDFEMLFARNTNRPGTRLDRDQPDEPAVVINSNHRRLPRRCFPLVEERRATPPPSLVVNGAE